MNMRRDKSAAVGLVIFFVAMITIVGAAIFTNYKGKSKEDLAKTEEEQPKTEEEKKEPAQITQGDSVQAEITKPSNPIVETPVKEKSLSFSDTTTLAWPIEGNVLMSYSMDQTIYFATLDQYKYNPALVIGGQVGQEVQAVEDGEVVEIKKEAETGTTVTIHMGDGYHAIYGQLGEVYVEKGKRVAQGDIIGSLGEPTKYYSTEGCNLYFQLLKDGNPINPLEYLDI